MELAAFAIFILLVIACAWLHRNSDMQRRKAVDNTIFPRKIFEDLIIRHHHLSEKDLSVIEQGLRLLFHAQLGMKGGEGFLPSRIVGEAWYNFSLLTPEYKHFCQETLGEFAIDIHCIPSEMYAPEPEQQEKTWKVCCEIEGIDCYYPDRLPLLYSIDQDLAIKDGFHYSLQELRFKGIDRGLPCETVSSYEPLSDKRKKSQIMAFWRSTLVRQAVFTLLLAIGAMCVALTQYPESVTAVLVPGPLDPNKVPAPMIWVGACLILLSGLSIFGITCERRRLLSTLRTSVAVPMIINIDEIRDNTENSTIFILIRNKSGRAKWKVELQHETWNTRTLGSDLHEARVYLDTKDDSPVVIETRFGLLWVSPKSAIALS